MGKKTTATRRAGGQKGGQGFSLYPRGKSSPSSWNGDGESMFLGVARAVDPAHTRLPSPFPSPLFLSLLLRVDDTHCGCGSRRKEVPKAEGDGEERGEGQDNITHVRWNGGGRGRLQQTQTTPSSTFCPF